MDAKKGRRGGKSHACGQETVEQNDGFEEVGSDGEDIELAGRFVGEGEGFEQDPMDTYAWTIEHNDVHGSLHGISGCTRRQYRLDA